MWWYEECLWPPHEACQRLSTSVEKPWNSGDITTVSILARQQPCITMRISCLYFFLLCTCCLNHQFHVDGQSVIKSTGQQVLELQCLRGMARQLMETCTRVAKIPGKDALYHIYNITNTELAQCASFTPLRVRAVAWFISWHGTVAHLRTVAIAACTTMRHTWGRISAWNDSL